VNLSALIGTVGSKVVLDFVQTTATSSKVVLSTGRIVCSVECIVICCVIVLQAIRQSVTFITRLNTVCIIAPVAVIVTFILNICTNIVLVFFNGLQVGSNKRVHVDDVISVLGGAPSGFGRAARVRCAETKANEALRLDAHVILVLCIGVPLADVMTALELDRVPREKAIVDIGISVESTSLGEETLA
jgi:hypothetical protein